MNTEQNRLGYYVGVCHNHTAQLSANLVLLMHGLAESRVHGQLGLYGDLGGGGPFHGNLATGSLSFTTCEPTIQLVIDWRGKFTGTELSGTYDATCDHPDALSHGLQYQQGHWASRLARSLDDPDPSRMHLVSVFDQGRRDGPFTLEDFARFVRARRWPLSAVVALDDLTTWGSLADFLAFLESQAPQMGQPPQPSFARDVARDTGRLVVSSVLATLVLAAFGINTNGN
jgi:hypothetical protein